MKRVIFTESQIKKILGEDVFTYSREGAESESSNDLNLVNNVQPTGGTDHENRKAGPDTDKVAKTAGRRKNFLYGTSRSYLPEENSNLLSRKFYAGNTFLDGQKEKTIGAAAAIKSDAKNSNRTLDKREQQIVNQETQARNTDRQQKETMAAMGQDNAFIKPHKKQANNGMAHKKKNFAPKTPSIQNKGNIKLPNGPQIIKGNNVTITYEN